MIDDPDDRMRLLFEQGDPAAELSPQLARRVAARLRESAQPRPTAGWARAAVTGALLLSSAGLGAVVVLAEHRLTRGPVDPAPAPAATHPAAPAIEDSTAREAAQLQRALEALHAGNGPEALRRIEALQRDFPNGLLTAETRVARIRTLLLLSRDSEALRELRALPESELTVELRLTWADALVRNHRCDDALAVLDGAAPRADDERAVVAALRARCTP